MSLWLQAVLEYLDEGDYKHVRENLLPISPIPIPKIILEELEFGERFCQDIEKNRLFPIRFIWLLEANEQRMFGQGTLSRSKYQPEKIMTVWERISNDEKYKKELEDQGFRFNLEEKAMELIEGWVYIGDHFIEDYKDIENLL